MKHIIGIFCYPMDNSTRAQVFESMPDVNAYLEKWKTICYLVVAFECNGEIFLGDSGGNEK